MGTRSTTKIYENGQLILSLYKTMDGYTESWGKELKDFLKSKKVVSGYSMDEKEIAFNGAGCFALQLVKKFKEGIGGLYATTPEDEQEYNYVIEITEDKVLISCREDLSFEETIEIRRNN